MKKQEFIKVYKENLDFKLKYLGIALDKNNFNEATQYITCNDCPLRY